MLVSPGAIIRLRTVWTRHLDKLYAGEANSQG